MTGEALATEPDADDQRSEKHLAIHRATSPLPGEQRVASFQTDVPRAGAPYTGAIGGDRPSAERWGAPDA